MSGCKKDCTVCDNDCINNKKSLAEIFGAVILYIFAFILQSELSVIIFIIAYIVAGFDVITDALKSIKQKFVFDENFLMVIATLGAIMLGDYPEAVMVMVLYRIGEFLQEQAVGKSRKSIAELMDIAPKNAYIEENGNVREVKPEDVKIGDILVVKTGERIPLDGIVTEGSAEIDTSALTGESKYTFLSTGQKAVSGCINVSGLLKIRVEKELSSSTVSKILELVENAGEKKAKSEKYITKFARYYTPAVVILAFLLILIPTLLFHKPFNIWVNRALIFLVISCPCAFVISVPLSFFAGIGSASRSGILIKGSNYIEHLSHPNTILFDKTGTLTKGKFKVSKIVCEEGYTYDDILKYGAIAEYNSNHPIALSVKNAYKGEIDKNKISEVEEFVGKGTKVTCENDVILIGSGKFLDEHNIIHPNSNDFGTIIYLAKNYKYIGYILISDEIKEYAAETIEKLRNNNIKTVMLTGDVESIGQAVGYKLNFDEIRTQMLPGDKVKILEYKIKQNQTIKGFRKSVLFVGDGINDAPVLRRADVGIAMGGLGSDAAIEAADVVIMNDELSKIPLMIDISKRIMRVVNENIAFAIIVKFLFLLAGALGYMTLWGAVFADVGVTVLAVLNSLRLLKT